MSFGKKTAKTPKKLIKKQLPNLRKIWKLLNKKEIGMSDFWESRKKMGESPYLNLSCEVVQENLRKIEQGRKEEIDAELMAGMMISIIFWIFLPLFWIPVLKNVVQEMEETERIFSERIKNLKQNKD